MKHILFSFSIFFAVQFSYSQNPSAEKAGELFSNGKYAEAISLRREILESIEDEGSDAYKEQLYKIKKTRAYMTGSYKVQLKFIKEALKIFNSLEKQPPEEKILLQIGYFNNLIFEGKLDKAWEIATDTYKYTLAQNNEGKYGGEIVRMLTLMGAIKFYQRQYQAAANYYSKALEKSKEVHGYYSLKTAEITSYLGVLYGYLLNTDKSFEYKLKALKIYEVAGEDKYLLLSQYNSVLQELLAYGDLIKAKEIMGKLTEHYKRHKGFFSDYLHIGAPNLNEAKTVFLGAKMAYATATMDSIGIEMLYERFQKEVMPDDLSLDYTEHEKNIIFNLILRPGVFFDKTDNYEKAKKYFLKSLEFSQSTNYQQGILQAYYHLAHLARDQEKHDEVIHYVKKAFENPGFKNFTYANFMKVFLGQAYFAKEKYDKAFAIFNKTLDYYSSSKGKRDNTINSIFNLDQIGQCFLKMHEKQPNEKKHLQKAFKTYLLSSNMFSQVYQGGSFNKRLAKYQANINKGLLLCAVKMGKHLAKTLEQVETNNSNLLWSKFLTNHNSRVSKKPLKLQAKLDSLTGAKKKIELALENTDKAKPDSLKQNLENTKEAIAKGRSKLKKEYTSFSQFSQSDFNLESLQSQIGENELFLRYVLTDSLLFAYGITKNDLWLERLPVNKTELRAKVNDYLSDIKNIEASYREKAKGLFAVLIKPMKIRGHEKLTIVTDGFLGYLPFGTLIGDNGRFLVQDHQIAYSTSLKLWGIQNKNDKETKLRLAAFSPEYGLALVANTKDKAIKTLVRAGNYELPGAEKEAKKINALFDGKLFMAGEATKANFVENAGKYDVLHLAMHAVLNKEDPSKSSLIFENNEKLYLPEFYNLEIPAQLAVLSACNTGAGEIKKGEGVQSLSRAFTYAGVKSTVMSLWPVPDQETSEIMVSFYKNLKKGLSKDKALQQAKLGYLNNTESEKLKHPYYWAGFVVSGNTSPLVSESVDWWWIAGALILVLLAGFVWWKKKNTV